MVKESPVIMGSDWRMDERDVGRTRGWRKGGLFRSILSVPLRRIYTKCRTERGTVSVGYRGVV